MRRIHFKAKILYTICLLAGLFVSNAQQEKLDSLEQLLSRVSEDTVKVNLLNKIGEKYQNLGKHKKSRSYLNQAMEKGREVGFKKGVARATFLMAYLNMFKGQYNKSYEQFEKSMDLYSEIDHKKGLALVYGGFGVLTFNQGKYEESITWHKKALKKNNEINDLEGVAASYGSIANVYRSQGVYDKAIKYYLEGLEIAEKINNMGSMANFYNNIGLVHQNQGHYDKAIEWFEKTLELCQQINNPHCISYAYGNIGNIYGKQGKNDSSIVWVKKALQIQRKLGNKKGIATAYTNIGLGYSGLYKDKTEKGKRLEVTQSALYTSFLDSAEKYLINAYEIQKKIGDRWTMTYTLNGIGEVFYYQNQYREAIRFYLRSASLADSIGAQKELYEAYRRIAGSYEKIGQIDQAYHYYKKFHKVRDTVHSQKSEERIAAMEQKYQAEKKQRKIEVLEKEKEKQQALARARSQRQRIMIYSVSGGLLLVLVFTGLLYNRFRVTRRQKTQIQEAHEALSEKNRAITDSINYAQRIQSAILTAEEILSQTLKDRFFILFRPKEQVSGDFYWAHQSENRLIWAAVDCTGHGVPGAFMSMIGNQLLNEIVIEKETTEAGSILNQLRDGVIKTLQQKGEEGETSDGMDMALCVWDQKKHILQYAGANNPLYLIRNSKKSPIADIENTLHLKEGEYYLFEIRPDKQPIGYYADPKPFETKTVNLEKGDSLYVFTDGYADQFGGMKGKKFMYKRFRKLLLDIQDKSMDKQKKIFNKTIKDWMAQNDEEQIDDICVVGIQV